MIEIAKWKSQIWKKKKQETESTLELKSVYWFAEMKKQNRKEKFFKLNF